MPKDRSKLAAAQKKPRGEAKTPALTYKDPKFGEAKTPALTYKDAELGPKTRAALKTFNEARTRLHRHPKFGKLAEYDRLQSEHYKAANAFREALYKLVEQSKSRSLSKANTTTVETLRLKAEAAEKALKAFGNFDNLEQKVGKLGFEVMNAFQAEYLTV